MSVITVPPVLEDKLGHVGAQALVDLLNASQNDFKDQVVEICEERFEARLTSEISNLRVEIVQRIADLETRLTRQIEQGRTEILKWMLLFWVGQFAVLVGILFAFFKH